jgi:hypothetical protein
MSAVCLMSNLYRESECGMVYRVLSGLSEEAFKSDYPLDFISKTSVYFYMANFYGHLNYHLGQVNYLRRILEA